MLSSTFLHKARHVAVFPPLTRQEGLQILRQNLIQDRLLGISRAVRIRTPRTGVKAGGLLAYHDSNPLRTKAAPQSPFRRSELAMRVVDSQVRCPLPSKI